MLGIASIACIHMVSKVQLYGQLWDKNLTGHRSGHRVMDCSPSSVAGQQRPESINTSVCLSVIHIARTVACALVGLDLEQAGLSRATLEFLI